MMWLIGLLLGFLIFLTIKNSKQMADLKAELNQAGDDIVTALENLAGDIDRLTESQANVLDEATVAKFKGMADRAREIAGKTPEPDPEV